MRQRDDDAAFPRSYSEQQPGDRMEFCYAQDGMDMREWYAGQALPAVLNMKNQDNEFIYLTADSAAEEAFRIADAMIERSKK
jgi:hypothetical protein